MTTRENPVPGIPTDRTLCVAEKAALRLMAVCRPAPLRATDSVAGDLARRQQAAEPRGRPGMNGLWSTGSQ